jgi:hypothetical protein
MYAQNGYYIWVDSVRLDGDIIINAVGPKIPEWNWTGGGPNPGACQTEPEER